MTQCPIQQYLYSLQMTETGCRISPDVWDVPVDHSKAGHTVHGLGTTADQKRYRSFILTAHKELAMLFFFLRKFHNYVSYAACSP